MWLASEMAAFAQVCELKSFTAAARALGVPKVAVSRAIASLEKRLGTRLLTRTTRRVEITPAGALLRPHCQRVMAEVEAVRARFAPASGAQRLRVLVDPGYGRLLVTPLVPRFLEHYAQLELHVSTIDALPEGPGEDWDVLICSGDSLIPALTQTVLGAPPLLLVATPAYLAQHQRVRTPADLAAHTVLRTVELSALAHAGPVPLRLKRDAEQLEVRVRPALQVNDPALVHSSTAAGLGIGVLPEFLCRQGLAMNKLARVLPEWTLAEPLQLRALYPSASADAVSVRQFVEFLLANMVPVLGGT